MAEGIVWADAYIRSETGMGPVRDRYSKMNAR